MYGLSLYTELQEIQQLQMKEKVPAGTIKRMLNIDTKDIPGMHNSQLMDWVSYKTEYNKLTLFYSPQLYHVGKYELKLISGSRLLVRILRIEVEEFETGNGEDLVAKPIPDDQQLLPTHPLGQ